MKTKSFIKKLFDFSFSDFITPKIIKFLYALCMIAIAIIALIIIIGGFSQSFGFGILSLLVLAPLFVVIYLLLVRVWLEIAIVFFKIHDELKKIRKNK